MDMGTDIIMGMDMDMDILSLLLRRRSARPRSRVDWRVCRLRM